MREEISRWWEQALSDMDAAKSTHKIKKYSYSSFWCQQAAEKSLKTLLLKRRHSLIKTHDLVSLSRKLNAPDAIIQLCKELTPVYVETRYPDTGGEGFRIYTREEAEKDIKRMEAIIEWTKKNLF